MTLGERRVPAGMTYETFMRITNPLETVRIVRTARTRRVILRIIATVTCETIITT
jgi:hypothetical protein